MKLHLNGASIGNEKGVTIALACGDESQAILMVQAVNSHDQLVGAIDAAQEAIDHVFEIMDRGGDWGDAEIWLNNLAIINQAALYNVTKEGKRS